jgi:hypothetical protein
MFSGFNFTVTGIDSLPFTAAGEACEVIFHSMPEAPTFKTSLRQGLSLCQAAAPVP